MKIVKYYDDLLEANIDREFLEAEGITAIVLNENLSNVMPLSYAIPSLRPHIAVADGDLEKAREVLKMDIPKEEAHKCTECGSEDLNFSFSQRTPFVKKILRYLILPATVLSPGMGMMRRVWHCNNCGHESRPD